MRQVEIWNDQSADLLTQISLAFAPGLCSVTRGEPTLYDGQVAAITFNYPFLTACPTFVIAHNHGIASLSFWSGSEYPAHGLFLDYFGGWLRYAGCQYVEKLVAEPKTPFAPTLRWNAVPTEYLVAAREKIREMLHS